MSIGSAVLALAVCLGLGRAQPTPPEPPPAEVAECNEQEPQDFLIRGNYIREARLSREENRARQEVHEKAIRYRTEQYGFFSGFGKAAWNPRTPREHGERIRVFNRPVLLNERIVPAVRCAEREVQRTCGHVPYQPVRLSGMRFENTYHSGEVSNHVYGIALDVDPHLNTCCGCIAKWRAHPLCQKRVTTIFERMAMPECWVHAFEKYGFYWLGHDRLQDTMHFEFLGRPERILKAP
jgi:hypothetical protein